MYDRDALLAAVDLRLLADELLGGHAGTARSPMWRCPNPQHVQTGRTPPVSVFTSHRGEQRWRCHGCGEGGTAIDLALACRGGEVRDALDYLARRAGHQEVDAGFDERQRPARPGRVLTPSVGCRDPDGLQGYVDECAERLWQPVGRGLRRWLTNIRGLPPEVLRENWIGADLGAGKQDRPAGMPSAIGVVLPVVYDGRAVYAQIRVPHPMPGRPRYLNPTADFAPNPRLARFRPTEPPHREVIVTEGALSAASAGYRAIAVLSAAYGDEAVAVALAKLPHPLVLAFDADDAGRAATGRLATFLDARQRPPVVLDLGQGDINEAMCRSDAWSDRLEAAVTEAVANRSAAARELLAR